MSTSTKKSTAEKLQGKREELAKLEARIAQDNQKRRKLLADISELENAELRQAIKDSGLTADEVRELLLQKIPPKQDATEADKLYR